jgi:hypothetical protein
MLVKLTCEFCGWREITRKKLLVKVRTWKITFVACLIRELTVFFPLSDLVRRKRKFRFTTEINYFISNLISNGKGENGISHLKKKINFEPTFSPGRSTRGRQFFPLFKIKIGQKMKN